MFKWFDFVEREDLYYQYKALSNFIKGEDLRGLKLRGTHVDVQGIEGDQVQAFALTNGKKAFLWVYDKVVTKVMLKENEVLEFKDVTLSLPMSGEKYVIEFWDTYRGVIIDTGRGETEEGILSISVPDFKRDLACKVIPMSLESGSSL